MKHRVVGVSTFINISGYENEQQSSGAPFLRILDGRPAQILTHSQFGWEDGCQERNWAILENPRYLQGNSGSPHHCGTIVVECDGIDESFGDEYPRHLFSV